MAATILLKQERCPACAGSFLPAYDTDEQLYVPQCLSCARTFPDLLVGYTPPRPYTPEELRALARPSRPRVCMAVEMRDLGFG